MFPAKTLAELLKKHNQLFTDLIEIKTILNRRFAGMQDPIHCLVLAVASGESMLMIGPPGTAKSRLIRAFAEMCELIGKDELTGQERRKASDGPKKMDRNSRYFEYLLTPFTEPGELFGFFDIAKLMKPGASENTLVRLDKGMMQHAEIVFLDEVFNASSAILNSLLTFVNERKFHDRGESHAVNLSVLFGATNFPPKRAELSAIYDRFLLRTWLESAPADPNNLTQLLTTGWRETNAADTGKSFPKLIENAAHFRHSVELMSKENGPLTIASDSHEVKEMLVRLACVVEHARRTRLSQVSNRRLVRFMRLYLVNALLRAVEMKTAPKINAERDLGLLIKYGLDRPPDHAQSRDFHGLFVGA